METRANGRCYNCDEQFTPDHNCKRLFWIKVTTLEEEKDSYRADNIMADPKISLHSIIWHKKCTNHVSKRNARREPSDGIGGFRQHA